MGEKEGIPYTAMTVENAQPQLPGSSKSPGSSVPALTLLLAGDGFQNIELN